MAADEQYERLHANRQLYCWWCDREIEPRQGLATDALGRPLHAGACAELSAEFDHDEDDVRMAAIIEQHGQPVGDEFYTRDSVASVYTGVEHVLGYAAAVVWRRKDGGVEVERHVTAMHAILGLEADRRAAWTD